MLLISAVSRKTIYGKSPPRNLRAEQRLTIHLPDIESVIALPGIGIQLESQTGYFLPHWPLSLFSAPHDRKTFGLATTTTIAFVPLSSVRPSGGSGADSVFLHEGLQRWSIRFYLGVLYSAGERSSRLLSAGDVVQDTWRVQVLFPVSTVWRERRSTRSPTFVEPATSSADLT